MPRDRSKPAPPPPREPVIQDLEPPARDRLVRAIARYLHEERRRKSRDADWRKHR